MATPAQIEAVARALHDHDSRIHHIHHSVTWDVRPDRIKDIYRHRARTAIAAYEATRPAVATDEELIALYEDTYWSSGTHLDHESNALAAIRAVRERLAVSAPEPPEWVNSVYIQLIGDREQDNEGGMWWERVAHGDGPTIEAALAAARAEAGKEASNG